jgi:hypothetical protein
MELDLVAHLQCGGNVPDILEFTLSYAAALDRMTSHFHDRHSPNPAKVPPPACE